MTGNRLERRLATVSDEAFCFSALLKPDGEVLEIDRQALAFWGLREDDVKGKRVWEIGWRLAHDEGARRLQTAVDAAAAGRVLRREAAVWDTHQQATSLAFSLRPVRDQDGSVVLLVANVRNLSRHSQVEAALRRLLDQSGGREEDVAAERERARAALCHVEHAVIVSDAEGRIEFANAAAGELLGTEAQALAGQPLTAVLQAAGGDPAGLDAFLADVAGGRHGVHRQELIIARDDRPAPLQLSCSKVALDTGLPAGHVTVLRSEAGGADAVPRDPLTGLPTRGALLDALRGLLGGGPSGDHSLCYIDLDAFQQIEQRHGREAAGQALAAVARELREHARRGDLLARLDSDAFGLLLRDCTLDNARPVADALLRSIQDARLPQAGAPAPQLSASIGLIPLRGVTSGTSALQLAKHACLRAKEAGGNRLEVGDPATAGEQPARPSTLRTSRLRLLIQPLAAIARDDRPAHAEVLLRVADKGGELRSPSAFLAGADQAELMAQLDRWVIVQVLAHDAQRRQEGRKRAAYSINLSAQSVLDPDLASFVVEQCQAYEVAPQQVCFELDEAVVLGEPRALALAEALRAAGFAVALDDCGISGRNIGELRSLPVDYLKIGGSLIRALTDDPVDGILVDAINRIAHLSGKRTVAKWVESAATLGRVRGLQLDYAQGFAVAEPVRLGASAA